MDESFKIENDKTAEWALKKIRESEEERDRLIALAEEEIKDLNGRIDELKEKCTNETTFLKSCLKMYFESVPHKATKTQESYKLLSGTLVYKKPSAKIIHDDDALIKALDGTEYVEIKLSLKWGDYKKNLGIEGDKVIDVDTGEVIDACKVETVPGDFSIKF